MSCRAESADFADSDSGPMRGLKSESQRLVLTDLTVGRIEKILRHASISILRLLLPNFASRRQEQAHLPQLQHVIILLI